MLVGLSLRKLNQKTYMLVRLLVIKMKPLTHITHALAKGFRIQRSGVSKSRTDQNVIQRHFFVLKKVKKFMTKDRRDKIWLFHEILDVIVEQK